MKHKELRQLAEAYPMEYDPMGKTGEENMQRILNYNAFVASANPAAILSILDELEALATESETHKENAMRNARLAVAYRAERDALQAKLDDYTVMMTAKCDALQAENQIIEAERDLYKSVVDRMKADIVGQKPVGVVEAAIRGAGGFHVKLAHGAVMPLIGRSLYTQPKALEPEQQLVADFAESKAEYSLFAVDHAGKNYAVKVSTAEHFNKALEDAVQKLKPIYAFRRKGLEDFCTCTRERYLELSKKPALFEVREFYESPLEALK